MAEKALMMIRVSMRRTRRIGYQVRTSYACLKAPSCNFERIDCYSALQGFPQTKASNFGH